MVFLRISARRTCLPLLLLPVVSSVALGAHATINLQVIGPKGSQEASADHEPPPGGVNPRPRMTVNSGDPLVLQFMLTNEYPHGLLKDATVRYFVVRTSQFDVKQVPELTEGVVTQGAATLDFKPKGRVGARLKFRIDEPGIYLVRVDTQNTNRDHEHFAAIDLEVK